MKLNDDQVMQFKLFGFVLIPDLFSPNEMGTLQSEFLYAAKRNEAEAGVFDNSVTHTFSMLGNDTPLYSSLLEDSRFYGPASQLFGTDVFGLETNGYRYIENTPWHFNDGAPNVHGYGPKYQFPVFESVTPETGSLRFIPGSHKESSQKELTQWWPLASGSSRSPEAVAILDRIPSVAIAAKPGDVVLFDMRLVHATYGGSSDRRMSAVTYYHYPETPEELEVMRVTAKEFYKSPTRWNKVQWDEWFSDPHGSRLRQSWINTWERLAKTPQSATGLRLDYDSYETTGYATFKSLS